MEERVAEHSSAKVMLGWRAASARACVACVLALGLVACGGCPREGGTTSSAEGAEGTELGNDATTAGDEHPQVASQGPEAHETPAHDLVFDDHALSAGPSDAPPERLTQEMISHIVQGQIADVLQCYEAGLHRDAAAQGRVVVLMHISASGNVVSTEVSESSIADQAVGACIATHAQHWHFPESQHDIAVTYPFVLTPRS